MEWPSQREDSWRAFIRRDPTIPLNCHHFAEVYPPDWFSVEWVDCVPGKAADDAFERAWQVTQARQETHAHRRDRSHVIVLFEHGGDNPHGFPTLLSRSATPTPSSVGPSLYHAVYLYPLGATTVEGENGDLLVLVHDVYKSSKPYFLSRRIHAQHIHAYLFVRPPDVDQLRRLYADLDNRRASASQAEEGTVTHNASMTTRESTLSTTSFVTPSESTLPVSFDAVPVQRVAAAVVQLPGVDERLQRAGRAVDTLVNFEGDGLWAYDLYDGTDLKSQMRDRSPSALPPWDASSDSHCSTSPAWSVTHQDPTPPPPQRLLAAFPTPSPQRIDVIALTS